MTPNLMHGLRCLDYPCPDCRDEPAPPGHAYEYPDSFCECGHGMTEPWHEYAKHLLYVTADETQLPLAAVMTPVPNKPKTPLHSFRCPDELWKAAQAKAEERGDNWSEELRKMVERYVKRK